MVGKLLSDEGIAVQPPLEQARRDDWLVLSIPAPGVRTAMSSEPRPTAEWFAGKARLRLGSEREMEMHFVSPLFEELGFLRGAGSRRVWLRDVGRRAAASRRS
jgi:hypothetical protein